MNDHEQQQKYICKQCFLFILSASIAVGEQPALKSVSMREKLLMDFGWRFHLGDAASTDTMELL